MTLPTIRHATTSDLRFIHSSWHQSFWSNYAKTHHVDRAVYAPEMDKRIDRLLENSVVLVAYFPEVPDEVLGYSVSNHSTCHWVYVKGAYRRQGIGKGLVPSHVLYYSHPTDAQGRLFAKSVGMQFNPFRQEHP